MFSRQVAELYKPTWLKMKKRLDCKPGQSQKCLCILSASDLELQKKWLVTFKNRLLGVQKTALVDKAVPNLSRKCLGNFVSEMLGILLQNYRQFVAEMLGKLEFDFPSFSRFAKTISLTNKVYGAGRWRLHRI